MNVVNLSNFAVLKSFSDNGKSTLDSLMPFVEFGIAEMDSEYIQVNDLKDFINRKCLIDIPTNTIITLLKRLKRDNCITDYEHWTIIRRVDNYKKSSDSYKTNLQDFSRDVNQFLQKCREFCGFTNSDDELSNVWYDYIKTYQHNIDTQNGAFKLNVEMPKDGYTQLSDFILHISSHDKVAFQTFKNVFYGFILAQFVTNGGNFDRKKVNNLCVYVDTDFLLRILDMQAPHFKVASSELQKLLESCGFSLVVLPETIEEIRGVLNANYMRFCREGENLKQIYGPETMHMDGVLGAYFRRNMTVTEIEDYIDNLEEHIKAASIEVSPTGIPASIIVNQKEFEKIVEYKEKSSRVDYIVDEREKDRVKLNIKEKATLDAKLMAFIRQKRGKRISRFQDAKYILLSCDNVICRVNKYNHNRDSTVSECISENALTNILFLSNPGQNGEAPIRLLLSLFQSSRYVDYEVLCRFHEGVESYIENNPQDQQYLTGVFRNQKLFSELNGCYDSENDGTTAETDLISALFKIAKENQDREQVESKKIAEENAHLKSELDRLRNQSEAVEIDESPLKSDEHSKTSFSSSQFKNEKAEGLLRIVIIGLIVIICLPLAVLLLRLYLTSYSLTLAWWTKFILLSFPLIFVLSFSVQLYEKEMDKIIKRIIYEDKNEPLLGVFLITACKSMLWMVSVLIVPIVVLILSFLIK